MEDKEDRLVALGGFLFLNIFLMLVEQFRVEADIAWLVNTVDVAKAGGNGEIRGDGLEGLVDVVNILRLGVEGIVVNILVVDAIFLTSGDADFLHSFQSGSSLGGTHLLTISRNCFMGAALFKYLAVVSMFQSTGSSDKSIMWEENKGSLCSLK